MIKMMSKLARGGRRAKFIRTVMKQSEIAHELFNIPKRSFEELYAMKINDLRNLEIELRNQIGLKRNFAFRSGGD